MPDTVARFYHPHFTQNINNFQSLFGQVADRLATLCATFGDIPVIRYHTGQTHSRLCETLAQQLQTRVARLNESKTFTRQQSQIVIIDRSYDLSTIFMHGTTFQSQIYDILNVGVCSIPETDMNMNEKGGKDKADLPKRKYLDDVYTKTIIDDNSGDKRKDFVLTDINDLYARVRHKEAVKVSQFLARELNQYKSESKTQKVRMQNVEHLNNEEVMAGLRELPQYRAIMDDFTSLINLSQLLISEYESESLVKLVEFENALASNFDEEGKVVKQGDHMEGLTKLLVDQVISPSNKLRLIILYFCVMRGIKQEQKESLMEKTSLGQDHNRMLRKFLDCGMETEQETQTTDLFGLELDKGKKSEKKNKGDKHTHKFEDDPETLEKMKKWVRAQDTVSTHYKPEVRTLLEDMINDRLPLGSFPYVQAPDHRISTTNQKVHADATGLKAKNKNWDFSNYGNGTVTQKDMDEADTGDTRKKMVLFVIGGITFTEMKYVYELAKSAQTDLYIGSTSIYTPKSFLEAIDKTVPDELLNKS
eukprot:GHVH01008174.1.p1 GENE.GHVH01008174.1~~GHVH01008174.1.p1  ORF type:complete len:533 (+),score=75.16 GHVH01008174.1:774-2372(+)